MTATALKFVLKSVTSLATGVALFAAPPNWDQSHDSPVATGKDNVATILAKAGKASPYLYRGSHARDFSHMQSTAEETAQRYRGMNIRSTQLGAEYPKELSGLKATCPALAKSSDAASPDISLWFVEAVKGHDIQAMPRAFIDAAYHTIGRSDGKAKTHALTLIQAGLADSPEYLAYIEEKRSELAAAMAEKPELQISDSDWQAMGSAEKTEILSMVSAMTLKILLPHNEIEFPRVTYAENGYPRKGDYGMYSPEFNDIYVDGTQELIRRSARFAQGITVHETFHGFVSMLIGWYAEGRLPVDSGLHRQARIYHLTAFERGAYISHSASTEGYLISPGERGARAFQLASLGPVMPARLDEDMFTFRTDIGTSASRLSPPVYRADAFAGRLPPACLPEASSGKALMP